MDPPTPNESLLPPNDKMGGMRYVTYRNKEQGSAPAANKDERLWCFEPTGFTYNDSDDFFSEISEWFCFDETDELHCMENAFYEENSEKNWQSLSNQQRTQYVRHLLDQLDLSAESQRLNVYRKLAYVSLGIFAECGSNEELKANMFSNATTLFQNGALSALIEALHGELVRIPEHVEVANNILSSPAVANLAIRPIDTLPLRLVMTPMYVMLESLRFSGDEKLKDHLKSELGETSPHIREMLTVTLFDMLTRFCNGDAPHYPIRKVVLLLWKSLLGYLGDLREAHAVKNDQRKVYGLPSVDEFTSDVCHNMRPCSPPPPDSLSGTSFAPLQTDGPSNESSDMKASNASSRASNSKTSNGNGQKTVRPPHYWRPKVGKSELEKFINERRMKFVRFSAPGDVDSLIGLPKPIHEAVRILKQHLYCSLAEVQLKEEEKLYRSPITAREIETHADLLQAENLFVALLPSLPQYCIAVLKLMLAAEPPPPSSASAQGAAAASGSSRTAAGTLSVLTDCVQNSLSGQTSASVAASLRSGVEVNRHRETILKALAAILLLLLKHFKAVHILHFELISQHLVFANALPLLVRLLSHNLCGLAAAANCMPLFEFPYNILCEENRQFRGQRAEKSLESEQAQLPSEPVYNWRIVHTAINLLRILNKLVKGKQHRIALLHSLRCAGLLKRTIRLKQPMAQFYALKLLKLQSRFLGRQWRRQNMHAVSAIYERIRHRLTDDWAYGAVDNNNINAGFAENANGKLGAGPNSGGNNASAVGPACPEFQAAESQLRNLIDKFHTRRYHSYSLHSDTFCCIDAGVLAGKAESVSLLMPSPSSNKAAVANNHDIRHICTDDLKCHCAVWSVSTLVPNDLASVCSDFFSAGMTMFPGTSEEWIKRELETCIDWDRLLHD